jgi:putative membrane protein
VAQDAAMDAPSPARTANQLAEDRTVLAVQRTVMAADRTLMAWMRTGLSMISFGFTLYKVLQALQAGGLMLPRETTPRNLGLFLTGLGTVALVVGVLEHHATLRGLGVRGSGLPWRPVAIIAFALALLGFFVFAAILIRVT